MVVVSLKDYAAQKNISYEAVRQQVVRYKDELTGHVIRDGRQQFLDEEAVAFLDAKRQKSPVAIIQQSKDDAIDALEQERDLLLHKIAAQADRIAELAQWKADKALEIASAEQSRILLTAAEQEKRLLEGFVADAKAEISVLSDERDQAEEKAQESARAAQRAQDELTAAQERERILAEYVANVAEYAKLPGWKRAFTKPPVPPEIPVPKED